MNRKARITLQVMSLGLGIAFGFGANQALAKHDEAAMQSGNSYQSCVDDIDCDNYCGGPDSGFCNSKGLCICF
jgi:hypothetical protein